MFAFEHISQCPWGSYILISCGSRDGFRDSSARWPAEAWWMAKMGICLWSPGRSSSHDLWCVPGAWSNRFSDLWFSWGFRSRHPQNLHWGQELLVKPASSSWDAQALCPIWRSSVAFHTADNLCDPQDRPREYWTCRWPWLCVWSIKVPPAEALTSLYWNASQSLLSWSLILFSLFSTTEDSLFSEERLGRSVCWLVALSAALHSRHRANFPQRKTLAHWCACSNGRSGILVLMVFFCEG